VVTEPAVRRDWVLPALADSPGGRLGSEFAVIEEVAIRFADRFAPTDRSYWGEQPLWQRGEAHHGRPAGTSLAARGGVVPGMRTAMLALLTAATGICLGDAATAPAPRRETGPPHRRLHYRGAHQAGSDGDAAADRDRPAAGPE